MVFGYTIQPIMDLNDRQIRLLRKIASKGTISAESLRQLVGAGRETLRKELLYLEELGLIERSYGRIKFVENEKNMQFLQEVGMLSKPKRHELIRELLGEHRELRLTFLAAKLNVSALTIRTDLAELERQGLVIKKHGAVSLLSAASATAGAGEAGSAPRHHPHQFDQRTEVLGRHSLVHINPGDRIFLGPGQISSYIAATVPLRSSIPIATNSLAIMRILMERNYTSPILVAPGTMVLGTGVVEVRNARSFFAAAMIDKAFFSVSSYSNKTFFLDKAEDQATALEICDHVNKIYLFLYSSTIDRKCAFRFPYDDYASKVQEILVDDGISVAEANLVFAKKDPVVIYGQDSAFRNLNRRKYRVGFIVNSDRNNFVQAVYNSVLESVAKYQAVALRIRECAGDYGSTVKSFDMLVLDKVDLVIDFSLCMESMIYVSEKCRIHGIKLMGIDLHLPGSVYFGADNALAGTLAGDRVAEYIRRTWGGRLDRIIVLGRHGMDPVTNLRVMSAVDKVSALVDFGGDGPVTIEWDAPGRNPAEDLMDLLKSMRQEERVLFFAFNLRHLMAAHEMIARHRGAGNTIMVGQNYNRQIEELMADPDSPIIGCVHYNPEEYGERIMRVAIKMLAEEPVDPLNYTTHTWIPNPART